jgi:hypothetical protein
LEESQRCGVKSATFDNNVVFRHFTKSPGNERRRRESAARTLVASYKIVLKYDV